MGTIIWTPVIGSDISSLGFTGQCGAVNELDPLKVVMFLAEQQA